MKLSAIKVDSRAIERGEWWAIPELGDMQVRVRGLFNKDYRRVMADKREVALRRLPMGSVLPSEEAERILAECLHETVLLDWKGLDDEDGKPIPYDSDLASMMLTDPDFVKFRNAVSRVAGMLSDGMKSELERDEGNSLPASGGSSSGAVTSRTSSNGRRRVHA